MKTFIVHIDKRRGGARVHQTDCPDLEKRSQDSLAEYFLRNLSARDEGAALWSTARSAHEAPRRESLLHTKAGDLAFEGCILDGFISRSMPRVRHGVAGLTWAGAGTPCQGRRLTSTCCRPPPTSALD